MALVTLDEGEFDAIAGVQVVLEAVVEALYAAEVMGFIAFVTLDGGMVDATAGVQVVVEAVVEALHVAEVMGVVAPVGVATEGVAACVANICHPPAPRAERLPNDVRNMHDPHSAWLAYSRTLLR